MSTQFAPEVAEDIGRGLVRLSRSDMAALDLTPGATVALEGARSTHARAVPAAITPGQLQCDVATFNNAGVTAGASVALRPNPLPNLSGLVCRVDGTAGVQPADLTDALFDMAVTEGDGFSLPVARQTVQVEILRCDPGPAGRISDATSVVIEEHPGQANGYEGIGGLHKQISQVHELIAAPLKRPDLFAHLGIPAPKGVLFMGPPGSGKTLLV
jgi:transitional endoplasmic reticulum ATPase